MTATSILLLAPIVACVGAVPVPANPEPRHARVALLAEPSAAIAGTTVNLGVHFRIDPTWHVYWHGRNDSGGPIEVELKLPPGFEAEPVQWPAPKRYISEGEILDHVYEQQVLLIIPVRVPPQASGTATISGTVKYVICSSSCVFEDAEVSLSLPIASQGAKPDRSTNAALFDAARATIPRQPPAGPDAPTIVRERQKAIITAPGAKGLTFYPSQDCVGLLDLIKTGSAEQARLVLRIDPETDSRGLIAGVLEVRYADSRGRAWYEIREKQDAVEPVNPGRTDGSR